MPLGLRFLDEDGQAHTFDDVLAGKPAILVFADYTCRTLCCPILAFVAAGLEQLQNAEGEFEGTGLDAIPESEKTGETPEEPWARKLAERLQIRAEQNRPGYMLLNPCAFTRRVALELDVDGVLPVEGFVKAAQFNADKARVVVEVPPLGFAWIPSHGVPGTTAHRPRIRMADGNTVRNEYFEAEIDPATGRRSVSGLLTVN